MEQIELRFLFIWGRGLLLLGTEARRGMALVFAPQRGRTLSLFCQLAQQAGLDVAQQQQYDAQVMDVHLKMLRQGKEVYDDNIHYPLLVTLTKGAQLISQAQ
ncbi:hypothetical protein fugu_012555 [Takifugu bimaculatus]|uniref:Uncharacterized protein n=1 Tax=Takifugu bimaculatus TaxID=433685 RepID=A0A4Z2C5P8_9TELE|nr:hypothetical protein fugu_012555 [Takifugu bimaculatus]